MHYGSRLEELFGGLSLSGCAGGQNIARLARSISASSDYLDSQFQLEVRSLGCYTASYEKEGTTSRVMTTTTSRPVSMIPRISTINPVIDARPRW